MPLPFDFERYVDIRSAYQCRNLNTMFMKSLPNIYSKAPKSVVYIV